MKKVKGGIFLMSASMEIEKANIIAIGVLITSTILIMLLYFLKSWGVYVQLGTPPQGVSLRILFILLTIVATVSGLYLSKDKIFDICIGALCLFIILSNLFSWWLFDSNAVYTIFSSPDKNEHFLVVETGYGTLYQLSSSGLFMTELAVIRTDDGYKPISKGAYRLEWKEQNKLIINYAFDYMAPNEYRKMNIEYKTY
ncbi:hypothetical protein [Robertmurraya kyonggiensis]|uniref:Uncharacterized protein n=1 Tax=Robertmurraya kyonggiensis TaxID=1037680 RepID=A0A4U1DAP6_9BACI|nr:hypothetical protein [Robertmurraya kyonggiensis]TKC19622.1 hypothetical protein FA727_08820 [Robertmurraya kyonggiensis]